MTLGHVVGQCRAFLLQLDGFQAEVTELRSIDLEPILESITEARAVVARVNVLCTERLKTS